MDFVWSALNDAAVGLVVDDVGELGVAEHSAAEEARLAGRERTVGVDADNINRRAIQVCRFAIDNRILLSVHRDTEFIVLTLRNVQAFAFADARVDAVCLASRRAVVAGAHDNMVFHNNGAVAAPEACCPPPDSLRDIKEICRPIRALLYFCQ